MKNLVDMLSIYGSYKATSRHDNSGAGKYVLGLLGFIAVGYLIVKGIVKATGFDSLYGMIGSFLVSGLKLLAFVLLVVFIFGIIATIFFHISSWLIGIANKK